MRDEHEEFSDAPEDDVERILRLAARYGARYQEAPDTTFQKWILGLCGALALVGVVGGIAMFRTLGVIEERQLNSIAERQRDRTDTERDRIQMDRMQGQINELIQRMRAQ